MTYIMYFLAFLSGASSIYFGQIEPVLSSVFLGVSIICALLGIIIDKEI